MHVSGTNPGDNFSEILPNLPVQLHEVTSQTKVATVAGGASSKIQGNTSLPKSDESAVKSHEKASNFLKDVLAFFGLGLTHFTKRPDISKLSPEQKKEFETKKEACRNLKSEAVALKVQIKDGEAKLKEIEEAAQFNADMGGKFLRETKEETIDDLRRQLGSLYVKLNFTVKPELKKANDALKETTTKLYNEQKKNL